MGCIDGIIRPIKPCYHTRTHARTYRLTCRPNESLRWAVILSCVFAASTIIKTSAPIIMSAAWAAFAFDTHVMPVLQTLLSFISLHETCGGGWCLSKHAISNDEVKFPKLALSGFLWTFVGTTLRRNWQIICQIYGTHKCAAHFEYRENFFVVFTTYFFIQQIVYIILFEDMLLIMIQYFTKTSFHCLLTPKPS